MEQVHNQPKFRGTSHQLMFFVSIIACALLIYKSSNPNETLATLVYALGLLSMFGFSALYHRTKKKITKIRSQWDIFNDCWNFYAYMSISFAQ